MSLAGAPVGRSRARLFDLHAPIPADAAEAQNVQDVAEQPRRRLLHRAEIARAAAWRRHVVNSGTTRSPAAMLRESEREGYQGYVSRMLLFPDRFDHLYVKIPRHIVQAFASLSQMH